MNSKFKEGCRHFYQFFHFFGVNLALRCYIGYIGLEKGKFAYMAMILDYFSRRIIAADLQEHMRVQLTLKSLKNALQIRQPSSGLIHHSDRGSQYAALDYKLLMKNNFICGSMSRKANPYDNAFMESCFGTIKTELEHKIYKNLTQAKLEIYEYINYYNFKRRHSSIDLLRNS